MADIFDQAAASATSSQATAGDIFDQAAAPQKDFSQRVGERIGQNVMAPPHLVAALADGMKEALNHPTAPTTEAGKKLLYPFGDSTVGKVAGIATVGPRSAYSVGSDLFHQYKDDPANLVGDLITAHVLHGVGEEGEGAQGTKPKAAGAPLKVSPDVITNAVGIISPKFADAIEAVRSGKYGKLVPERINRAIALAKNFMGGQEPPAPPTPEAPNVYGTPRAEWGSTIASETPAAQSPAAPTTATPTRVSARTVRQSQALGPNAQVLNQAEALKSVPAGDIFDQAASTPNAPQYAYRVRDVGEKGIPATGKHAQATTSLDEAQSYVPGRQVFSGKPQEVVRVDLSRLSPSHYELADHPNGTQWVKFNGPVPEGIISSMEVPKSPTPPIYPVKNISEWGVADQNKQMMRALSPARQGLNADFSSLGKYQPVKSVVAHTFGDLADDAAVEDALRNDLAKMAARGEFQEQRAMNEGSSMDVPKAKRSVPVKKEPDFTEFTSPWALNSLLGASGTR